MSTTLQEDTEEAIRLFTVQDEQGQVDSVVPLRWCISRETAEQIQERGTEKPQMLIVIEQDGQEMDRYVVPLEAQMQYVRFRRPGENVIHATIVWSPGYGYSVQDELKKYFGGGYYNSLIVRGNPAEEALRDLLRAAKRELGSLEGKGDREAVATATARLDQIEAELKAATDSRRHMIRNDLYETRRLKQEAELTVVVPKEMFAKEPPRWMQWLGKIYPWERAPQDQCALRRRALFTLCTLPVSGTLMLTVTMFAWLINAICTGVLLFFGIRNLDYRPLRRPMDSYPKDIWSDTRPSFWWYAKKEGRDYYTSRHPAVIAITPPVVVALSAIGSVLYLVFGSVLLLLCGVAAAFVIATVILVVSLLLGDETSQRAEKKAAAKAEAIAQLRKEGQEQLKRELEQLACTSASREVSISALPKERRTVVLRFQDLKSKVCRPYAR